MKDQEINPQGIENIYYPPGGILVWMVILLELLVFAMALVVLAYFSKDDPAGYHASRLLLNPTYGLTNTVVLLTSGFFIANSLNQYRKNNKKRALRSLVFSIVGGFLFLVLKTFEYADKINHGHTIGYDTFFSFYWLLTGFHVVHVLIGLFILVAIYLGLKKDKVKLDDFEAGAAFWHLCDLIWLLLFPMLYLIL